jgi:hypothetical protein
MNPLLTALNSNRGEGRRPPCSSQHSRPQGEDGSWREEEKGTCRAPKLPHTLTCTVLLSFCAFRKDGSPCSLAPVLSLRLCPMCVMPSQVLTIRPHSLPGQAEWQCLRRWAAGPESTGKLTLITEDRRPGTRTSRGDGGSPPPPPPTVNWRKDDDSKRS